MYIKPKIVLKIDGQEELNALLKKAAEQVNELKETVDCINVARLELQAQINQQPLPGLDSREIAIEAQGAIPVVNGRVMTRANWIKIEPDKATICFVDEDDDYTEKTREFDIRTVKLSSFPAVYETPKNAFPSSDNP